MGTIGVRSEMCKESIGIIAKCVVVCASNHVLVSDSLDVDVIELTYIQSNLSGELRRIKNLPSRVPPLPIPRLSF